MFFVLELQVHMCNKLASRHVRVGLADPSDVPQCDICEKAPGICRPVFADKFFFSRDMNF
jgi:hypothetical protein